jgi:hypothetical protein
VSVNVDNALWRAIGMFRVAALAYSVALAIGEHRSTAARPPPSW